MMMISVVLFQKQTELGSIYRQEGTNCVCVCVCARVCVSACVSVRVCPLPSTMLLSRYFPLGHTTSSLRSLTPLLVPSPSPPPKTRGVSQGLFHARLCGVSVLAHVRVRVRMPVCVMCLSARCASACVHYSKVNDGALLLRFRHTLG